MCKRGSAYGCCGPVRSLCSRLWIATLWLFLGLGLIWFQPKFANQFAYAGAIATVLGSRLLYWETFLHEAEAEIVAAMVLESGVDDRIRPGEVGVILGYMCFAAVFAGALVWLAVAVSGQGQVEPAWLYPRLRAAVLFIVLPAAGMWAVAKGLRVWVNREAQWLRRNSAPGRKLDAVKRVVRRIGFGWVVAGATLQGVGALLSG